MKTEAFIASSDMEYPNLTTASYDLLSWTTLFFSNDSYKSDTGMFSDTNDSDVNTSHDTVPEDNVHDIKYDRDLRIGMLYAQIVVGLTGAILVFIYMLHARRLTRVNALILNLCIGDLLVIGFSCVFQLVWEHLDRRWVAGDILCRLFKLLQIFAICASTNMLLVIAIDRHQAITAPLRKQFSVVLMTALGWGLALLCAMPVAFLFHVRYDDKEGFDKCENVFRGGPKWHRQAFLTYASLVNFFIPLIILSICYIRIFLKISRKASECRVSKRQSFKPGKIHLTSSNASTTLQSAKIKTLRMTVVIVTCYIVCGLPYFVAEMILSYGDFKMLNTTLYGIIGSMGVANSAVNPYIFLLFTLNIQCLRNFKLCPAQTGPNNRHQLMYSGSVRSREYNTPYSRTPTKISTTDVEMTSTSNGNKALRGTHVNGRWISNSRH